MRIAAYLYSAPPFRYVGGEMMTYQLLAWAKEAGHHVTVYSQSILSEHEYNGLKIYPAKGSFAPTGRIGAADIVVTHPELALKVRSAKRKIGIVHNLGSQTIDGIRGAAWECLVANSMFTNNKLSALRIKTTHLIYPPTFAHKDLGLNRNTVFMSNLSQAKGGDMFFKLAERLPHIDFIGVLGGYGSQPVLSNLGNVHMVGHGPLTVPVNTAKIVLSMSRSETYGMTIAEATQSGIPVIATSIPAHKEVLGQGATLLSPKTSILVWQDKIEEMLNSDLYYASCVSIAKTRGRTLDKRTQESKQTWLSLLESL